MNMLNSIFYLIINHNKNGFIVRLNFERRFPICLLFPEDHEDDYYLSITLDTIQFKVFN